MRFGDNRKNSPKTTRNSVPKFRWQLVIIVVCFAVVFSVIILSDIMLASLQMLQSLIQAEATVLGFFGVIAAYLLTSYDSRIDRFEQQWFDLTLTQNTKAAEEIDGRITRIRKTKKDTVKGIGVVSGFLIFSLIFGMVLLGIINSTTSRIVNAMAFGSLGCFFMGVVMIIFLFYQMSYEAETL